MQAGEGVLENVERPLKMIAIPLVTCLGDAGLAQDPLEWGPLAHQEDLAKSLHVRYAVWNRVKPIVDVQRLALPNGATVVTQRLESAGVEEDSTWKGIEILSAHGTSRPGPEPRG